MKKTILFKKKSYAFQEELGRGGYGKIILMQDDDLKTDFVCKKYAPREDENIEKYFSNFIREIKVLYMLHHRNIVRVFDYYLYPKHKTGYIIMEQVIGNNIDEYIASHPSDLNTIFYQVIEGFKYLEQKNILHRDIRYENILVSKQREVKIIDFGFGKVVNNGWEQSMEIPTNNYALRIESSNEDYDFKTEVYCVGQMFSTLIAKHKISDFAHSSLLEKMVIVDKEKRISSFADVSDAINKIEMEIGFTPDDKAIFQKFAGLFEELLWRIDTNAQYITDLNAVISNLKSFSKSIELHKEIRNFPKIVSIFILGKYRAETVIRDYNDGYYPKISTLIDFVKWLISSPKKESIFLNLWAVFDSIERENLIQTPTPPISVPVSSLGADDLPF